LQDEKPSATAWRVAVGRAAHQYFDTPRVFDDPLALRIVGAYSRGRTPETFFRQRHNRSPRTMLLRALLAVRSRIAEDSLAEPIKRGVRQYVLLGAGLDTFAYRNPYPDLRVFEVDHPATQAWKRNILERARVPMPAPLTYVALDFERQTAMDGLAAAGFDRSAPAFFAWLGVTMYVQEDAVYAVLRDIAALPPSSGVTFDYALSRSQISWPARFVVWIVNRRLQRIGEPWVTFFDPAVLIPRLRALGFHEVRDLDADQLNAAYFKGRADGLRVSPVGHVVTALV
jgi:methyltransferase (TIGR00027 family)